MGKITEDQIKSCKDLLTMLESKDVADWWEAGLRFAIKQLQEPYKVDDFNTALKKVVDNLPPIKWDGSKLTI